MLRISIGLYLEPYFIIFTAEIVLDRFSNFLTFSLLARVNTLNPDAPCFVKKSRNCLLISTIHHGFSLGPHKGKFQSDGMDVFGLKKR